VRGMSEAPVEPPRPSEGNPVPPPSPPPPPDPDLPPAEPPPTEPDEAELEALTAKLDPRHKAFELTGPANGDAQTQHRTP
jgi:hypothetical protein